MRAFLGVVASTGCGIAVFALLWAGGIAPETSLPAGLALTGVLNIHGLLLLNGDPFLPTSGRSAGENVS
jgi:hypothetical protein